MRLAQLRNFALGLKQTTVVKQWGECLVFKVAGKMFLLIALDGDTVDGVIVKCTPEEFDEHVEMDGVGQAPYCAKRMWIRISDLEVLPMNKLQKLILRSYDLVIAKLPKKVRLTLL